MSFQSVVCWQPDDIEPIAPIDVASIAHEPAADSAIFIATHQPLHLLRLAGAGATEGGLIDEHELRADFVRSLGNDPHITVITGAVGTGKSHMVKWLHAACVDHPGWHQVYIEKHNTNLRRVIETILAGLSGPRVAELRDQLKVASSAIRDLEEAKHRVLHELAQRVEFPAGSGPQGDLEREARKQLQPVLNDPILREHLLRTDGAVHRITRLGLEGLQRDDEDEHDLFFHDNDLPLQPGDLLDASQPAQRAIKLLARSGQLRTTAVEVLNRELAGAKAAVFLGTGVALTEVFDEVRKELAQRELELVLYIEDLVLLHGIDKELAQVFTEVGGGTTERCGMRVAIAVTEGYLASGLETLTSRAQHYSLNLRLGADVSADQARTFVGRYLNAIRVGVDGLKAARGDAAADDWVPNACDTCDHREACHTGFGADANSYGFYPLNDIAVDRLVRLADAATGDEGRFDPRKVLRHVVRDPLRDASDGIPEGRFPSASFAAAVDSTRRSVSVEVRARLGDTTDGDRRTTLLGFWAPEPVREVLNFDPIVHEAFRLPSFTGGTEVTYPPPGGETPLPPPPPSQYPELDAWANKTKVLPSQMAREIRQFVFDAVLEAVRQGPSGVRVKGHSRRYEVGALPFDVDAIRIEAAAGGGAEVERPFEIKLSQSPKTAVLLKAMLQAGRSGCWPAAQVDQYAVFTQHVDDWASQLIDKATARDVDLEPSITVLALTSLPDIAAAKTAGERLERALLHQPDPEPRGPTWTAWDKAVRQARQAAIAVIERSVSGAKGTGASSFVDGAAIAKYLDKAARPRQLGNTLTGTDEMVETQRRLRDQQEAVSKKVWSDVEHLITHLSPHIAPGSAWDRVVVDVEGAIDRAHNAGMLATPDARDELRDLALAVPDGAFSVYTALERKTSSPTRELWALVPDPVPALEALLAFCSRADLLLDGIEARLAEEDRGGTGGISQGTAVVAFRELADALDQTVGEEG